MHRRIKIAFLLTTILLSVAGYGWYLYTKKPADIRKQPAYKEVSANELVKAFEDDEAAATREYIDKVLIVSGTVANAVIDTSGGATLFFETGDPLHSVTCSFYRDDIASVKKIGPGKKVRVKGNCTGKLTDVVLNKCSLAD